MELWVAPITLGVIPTKQYYYCAVDNYSIIIVNITIVELTIPSILFH